MLKNEKLMNEYKELLAARRQATEHLREFLKEHYIGKKLIWKKGAYKGLEAKITSVIPNGNDTSILVMVETKDLKTKESTIYQPIEYFYEKEVYNLLYNKDIK